MDREIDTLAAQVWRSVGDSVADTKDYDGRSLCARALTHGWLRPTYAEPWFAQSEIGTVLKTGVSAYERIA